MPLINLQRIDTKFLSESVHVIKQNSYLFFTLFTSFFLVAIKKLTVEKKTNKLLIVEFIIFSAVLHFNHLSKTTEKNMETETIAENGMYSSEVILRKSD